MKRLLFIAFIGVSAGNMYADVTNTNTVSGIDTHQGVYRRWHKAYGAHAVEVAQQPVPIEPIMSAGATTPHQATEGLNAVSTLGAETTARPHPGGMYYTGTRGQAFYERAKQMAANRGTTTDEVIRASLGQDITY